MAFPSVSVNWGPTGAILGFRVIDADCVSSYFQNNYSSIAKGDTGEEMSARVQAKIEAGLLCIVDCLIDWRFLNAVSAAFMYCR